jgi:hypothetical protein
MAPNDVVSPKQQSLISKITGLFRGKSIVTLPDEDNIPIDFLTTERANFNWMGDSLFGPKNDRPGKYKDFDTMDSDLVELSSALDLYADFICANAGGEQGAPFTIDVETNVPQKVADVVEAFDERTNIQTRLWFMSRNVVKYGDAFYEIVASEKGIVKLKFLSPYECFVNIDPKTRRRNPEVPYIQRDLSTWGTVAEFAPWEIVHFKVGEDEYGVDYGLLGKLRRTFRIQRMLEDSLVVTRVVRAGQRGIYKIDVTGMGELEAARFIQRVKTINKKQRMFGSDGKIKQELDPLSGLEEIYIPTRRNGGVTDYQVISSDSMRGGIDDVEHFHNKLFAATKVPKAYLGYERDVNSKATLEQQHISFTKAVRRFRSSLADGIKKIYKVEFLLNGIDPNSFDWKVKFADMGDADEQTRWQIELLKAQVLAGFGNVGVLAPKEWIVKRLFLNLTPAEADELIDLMAAAEEQAKADAEAQAAQAQADQEKQMQQQFDFQQRMTALQYQGQPPATAPGEPAQPGQALPAENPPTPAELASLESAIRNNPELMRKVRRTEAILKQILRGGV